MKGKRSKARFESLEVVVAMGKPKKQRKLDQKTEREMKKDDAIMSSIGESTIIGDPRREKEVDVNKAMKVAQDRKIVDYQDMEVEMDSVIMERGKDYVSKEGIREGVEQDRSRLTNTRGDENKNKMVRIDGKLQYVEEIKNYSDIMKNQGKKEGEFRFAHSHKGELIVEAMLDPKVRSNNRDTNTVKIIQYLRRIGCNFDRIKNSGYGKAEVKFFDIKNANKCLDINKHESDKTIDFYIPNRVKRCRGIISDWDRDMTLQELAEAIDDNKRIIQLERMKSRRYNIRERRMELVSSHLILVTMEGNNLPDKVSLYGDVINIRVRPFIEPVRQCFNCLRFGHIGRECRNPKICITCGTAFHGDCNRDSRCVNCKNAHKANDKTCPTRQHNIRIKAVMAKKNISAYEAQKVLIEERNNSYQVNKSTSVTRDRDKQEPHIQKSEQISKESSAPELSWSEVVTRKGGRSTIHEGKVTDERRISKKSKDVEDRNMTQEYYKTFNTREEEITRNRRGIALRQEEVEETTTDVVHSSQDYGQFRMVITRLVEERMRRIEEKIDRQLMEHKRQMELIVSLLTMQQQNTKQKTMSEMEHKLGKHVDRVEEYRNENNEEEEEEFY